MIEAAAAEAAELEYAAKGTEGLQSVLFRMTETSVPGTRTACNLPNHPIQDQPTMIAYRSDKEINYPSTMGVPPGSWSVPSDGSLIKDRFFMKSTGSINIVHEDLYKFELDSDDASRMW